jgi:hypothetical protein
VGGGGGDSETTGISEPQKQVMELGCLVRTLWI